MHLFLKFQLKEKGYSCVDALDGSEGMLNQAKAKGIYKNYIMLLWDHIPLQELRKVCAFTLSVFDEILNEKYHIFFESFWSISIITEICKISVKRNYFA